MKRKHRTLLWIAGGALAVGAIYALSKHRAAPYVATAVFVPGGIPLALAAWKVNHSPLEETP